MPAAPNILAQAVTGSKTSKEALRKYRNKGGRISDRRWYGQGGAYKQARFSGFDQKQPPLNRKPTENEIQNMRTVYANGYYQIVLVLGIEQEIVHTKRGTPRLKQTSLMLSKEIYVKYKQLKTRARAIKDATQMIEKGQQPFQGANGSVPVKVVGAIYLKTYRLHPMGKIKLPGA